MKAKIYPRLRRKSFRNPTQLRAAYALGFFALSTIAGAQTAPAVLTDKGVVVGKQLPGSPAVDAFLGIPYAAPPVGNLRLRAPEPHAPWNTPVQATAVAKPCPQVVPVAGTVVGSEDCLYLNVYTPAEKSLLPRPVMVYIPGGGFVGGSASSPYYNGQAIARQSGVIVVTVTYRVGALGFLTSPALDAENSKKISGNYGIEDQQQALKWVRANIAAFGGNPFDVTLFGESAGANSVEDQLTSPFVTGLFQKTIIESTVGTPLIPNLTLAQSEAGSSAAIVSQVGCSTAGDVAACLRALPAAAFLKQTPGTTPAVTDPVVDGVVLPLAPLQAFQTGRFNRVPTIIGSNHDEFTSLIATQLPQLINPPLGAAAYGPLLQSFFGPGAAAVEAQYPLSNYPSPLQAFAAVGTDAFVACQTEAKRAALSQYVPVFGYEFHELNPATGPILGPPVPNFNYGDYHTAELPYVFGFTAPAGAPVAGKDIPLSHSIIGYWTNFAATGYPGGAPVKGDPRWPFYQERALISLEDQIAPITVQSFDNDHHCGFWNAASAR